MYNYKNDPDTTKEKILHATLKIIGKEGFQSITIKKIADLAGVNIAAVNYHFGSKANVIKEAMKVLNKRLLKSFDVLEDETIPPSDRLRNFLLSYTESAMEYPDVFRNFIYSAIKNEVENEDYVEFLRTEGVGKLKKVLKEAGAAQENKQLSMKMMQMICSLELPILLGKYAEQLAGLDYGNFEVRSQYIDIILRSLLS